MSEEIVVAFERIATLLKICMWETANKLSVSPLQIQILMMLRSRSTKAVHLARQLGLKKPTISHALKLLEQKKLIKKTEDFKDARSENISLTRKGRFFVQEVAKYRKDFMQLISVYSEEKLTDLYKLLYDFVHVLQKQGILSLENTCFLCESYCVKHNQHFCLFLGRSLENKKLRMDCPDFTAKPASHLC